MARIFFWEIEGIPNSQWDSKCWQLELCKCGSIVMDGTSKGQGGTMVPQEIYKKKKKPIGL